ncbi:MAG: ATP-binding cassette domain-containing protein, partial [Novosphingobium sp.]
MLVADALVLPGRLRGVSLSLRAGEVTAICGPNGAGKSSLLSCFAGLLEPVSGTVTLDGAPLAAMHPEARARAL